MARGAVGAVAAGDARLAVALARHLVALVADAAVGVALARLARAGHRVAVVAVVAPVSIEKLVQLKLLAPTQRHHF